MPYLNLKSKERDNKKGVRYNGYKAYFWITSFLILSSYQSSAHLLPVLAVPDSVRSAQWRQWRHRYSKVPRCTVVDGAENSLQIHAKQQVQIRDEKKGYEFTDRRPRLVSAASPHKNTKQCHTNYVKRNVYKRLQQILQYLHFKIEQSSRQTEV